MHKNRVFLLAVLALWTLAGAGYGEEGKEDKEGKTMFGPNRKQTMKTMGKVAKAIGVKCPYCHVKQGSKIKFEIDTPNKRIARKMKRGFVDSLALKGRMEIDIVEEDSSTTRILALYRAEGDSAGIYLEVKTGEKGKEKTFEKTLPLPEEGKPVFCLSCHHRQLHFLTGEEEHTGEKKK